IPLPLYPGPVVLQGALERSPMVHPRLGVGTHPVITDPRAPEASSPGARTCRVFPRRPLGSINGGFDEAEKAHPRVLDILLQLLDAARITVATGQTLDFSGFYIWLTSNIGSAELMSLQHSNDATLERHVLTRAQQSLRPEIFARVNEKLV